MLSGSVRIRPRDCHLASLSHQIKPYWFCFVFCFCLKMVNSSAWKMSNLLYLGEMRIGSIENCCLRTRGAYTLYQASKKPLLDWFLYRSHTLTQATEEWERTVKKTKIFFSGSWEGQNHQDFTQTHTDLFIYQTHIRIHLMPKKVLAFGDAKFHFLGTPGLRSEAIRAYKYMVFQI